MDTNQILEIVKQSFGTVNAVQLLVIGLVLSIFMGRLSQILFFSIAGIILHEGINYFRMGRELPDFTGAAFWTQAGTYLVSYFAVIAVFFVLKRIFVRG